MKPAPENISTCIREAVDKAMMNGLVQPTALYLGEEEDQALTAHAMRYLRFTSKPTDAALRGIRIFQGMTVYRVMEPSHLGVA